MTEDFCCLPRGYLKATRDEWEAWMAGPARDWTASDRAAARRLIDLIEQHHRADPAEQRRLAGPIRTASRDLGLHARKAKPKDDPHKQLRDCNKVARALCPFPWVEGPTGLSRRAEALVAEHPIEEALQIAESQRTTGPLRLVCGCSDPYAHFYDDGPCANGVPDGPQNHPNGKRSDPVRELWERLHNDQEAA